MDRRSTLFVTLLGLTLPIGAMVQEPGRGRGATAPRMARPPLFLKEQWKQTAAGGEHPVVPTEALANPNLEL